MRCLVLKQSNKRLNMRQNFSVSVVSLYTELDGLMLNWHNVDNELATDLLNT